MSPKLDEPRSQHINGQNGHGDGHNDNGDGIGYGDNGGRGPSGGGALPIPTAKLTLWIFMVAPTLIFSALTSAYVVRMGWPDWGSVPTPWTLWLNTGVLIASSIAIQFASWQARRRAGSWVRVRRWFYTAGALGALFMVGQLAAWLRLEQLGISLTGNPSAGFFYVITAIHGAHLLGGLFAWLWTERRARRETTDPAQTSLRIELCAFYWHFLLGIWLIMFVMMTLTT